MHIAIGTTRRVVAIGPWVFKFGRGKRGRAANRYEFGVWVKSPPAKRHFLCPSRRLILNGVLLISDRAKPFQPGEMTDELYLNLGTAWMRELPYDDAPFEPGDKDWGWIAGRPVAIDYALTQEFLDVYYPPQVQVNSLED